jgi:Zn-dependent protease
MTSTAVTCPHCGAPLASDALICPRCGKLVHEQELNKLATSAQAMEATDLRAAADLWTQCLALLPSGSPIYVALSQRAAALSQGQAPPPFAPQQARTPRAPDPLSIALFKTFGSMLLSIVVYMAVFKIGWAFATGFFLLILVHEMGHVLALRYYHYSASPPIFLPFIGAVINLRQPPRNAWEEAVIGIGGPVTGSLAAFVCYGLWLRYPDNHLLLSLAYFGFILNFFNMIPVPPLDGGRVTAAVSPWAWVAGLATIVFWFVYELIATHQPSIIMILILIFAFPRLRQTFRNRAIRKNPYYAIGRRANWTMGILYLALTVVLAIFYYKTSRYLPPLL